MTISQRPRMWIIVGLAVVLAGGFGIALIATHSSTQPRNSVGPAGGEVSAVGVKVRIPPGAVAKDTSIAIKRVKGSATTLLPGARARSPMFRISASGPLSKPVELHLPISAMTRRGGASIMAATREGNGDMWTVDPARVDRQESELVVKTRELSYWQVLQDAAFDVGIATTSSLLRIGGTRAEEPTCSDPPTGYSLSGDTGKDDPSALIFACLGQPGSDMEIKIVNNRAIGMELNMPMRLRVASRRGSGISEDLFRAAVGLFAGKTGAESIPTTGEITLAGAPAEAAMTVRPTLGAFVFDLGVFAVGQAGGKAGAFVDYLECLGNSAKRLSATPPGSVRVVIDAALGTWRDCGGALTRAGAAAAAKAGAVFFGGMKLGTGGIDALASLVTNERANLQVEEVPVGPDSSCGTVTTSGHRGRPVTAELVVEQGQILCSLATKLWNRYWAAANAPCDRQGAGTCWRTISGWDCVVPTAGSFPKVFACSEVSGEGELAGYDRSRSHSVASGSGGSSGGCSDFERRGIRGRILETDLPCEDALAFARDLVGCVASGANLSSCTQQPYSGFRCTTKQVAAEVEQFSCTAPDGSVKFEAGT